MDRHLRKALLAAMQNKIVLLSGPRQCGKTTLSRMLCDDYQYCNYDLAEHRLLLNEKSWDRQKPLVIFDELHKMKRWKAWLKGIFDVEGLPPGLLVTGSASLSAFRQTGDSLAGRHFHFRLHPLDMKEALAFSGLKKDDIFARLMTVGGFPEPFLKGTPSYYRRWQRTHTDLILKEDLLTLTAIRDIQAIGTLIELMRSRVGSPISVNALAGDLQKSPNTIRQWLQLLENLYVIFKVTPYHHSVARALLKAPKYYFYDNGFVKGDEGVRLENLVACALLKESQRAQDVDGADIELHYLRNKDGQELDFLITSDGEPSQLVEVKWRDAKLSPHFKKFLPHLKLQRTQVVGELAEAKSYSSGERIEQAQTFLANLNFAPNSEYG